MLGSAPRPGNSHLLLALAASEGECVGRTVVREGLTLHHCVGGLHRRQVGNDGDIVITVGVLNVNSDGLLHLPV